MLLLNFHMQQLNYADDDHYGMSRELKISTDLVPRIRIVRLEKIIVFLRFTYPKW